MLGFNNQISCRVEAILYSPHLCHVRSIPFAVEGKVLPSCLGTCKELSVLNLYFFFLRSWLSTPNSVQYFLKSAPYPYATSYCNATIFYECLHQAFTIYSTSHFFHRIWHYHGNACVYMIKPYSTPFQASVSSSFPQFISSPSYVRRIGTTI